MLELGLVVRTGHRQLQRGKQQLLHASLHGADREAFLELAVGGRLVEAVEGLQQARR